MKKNYVLKSQKNFRAHENMMMISNRKYSNINQLEYQAT